MMTRLLGALLAGLVLFASLPARAQEEEDEKETGESRDARLAREFNDPLTTLPQIFVQDAYTPANYGTDAQTNRVIARAIIPRIPRFSLFPFIQLIRPSMTLVTVPEGRGSATRTELGDSQLFDFAVMPGSSKERGLLWGAGPVFVFPTATHKTAGQGSWQAGPGVGAVYKAIPGVLLGGLIQNPISFAYTSPDRKPTSTLLIQPILLTHIGWGFYVKSADATWAINWRRRSSTTLPLSFGIGYVRNREGFPPINLFVTGEWMAYRQFAPVAPQTTIRFGMTMAFPGWKWWD
jgi:hypothetical protein